MKKVLTLIGIIGFAFAAKAQDTNQNYVHKTTYLEPFNLGQEDTALEDEKIETISYFDGLGRPLQSVSVRAGGNKENIIQYNEYDQLGRTSKQYLPFAKAQETISDPLEYIPQDVLKTNIEAFYNTEKYEYTTNPYAETAFSTDGLNRPGEQGAPGASWIIDPDSDEDHTVKMEYGFNRDTDRIRLFSVDFDNGNTEKPLLVSEGYYLENQLSKSIIKDENWTYEVTDPDPTIPDGQIQQQGILRDHSTEEFKNKLGQTILKRTYNQDQPHDTYYVYDDFGNLTFVIPPKASDIIIENGNADFSDQFIDVYSFWSSRQADFGVSSGGVHLTMEDGVLSVVFNFVIQEQELRNGVHGEPTGLPDMYIGHLAPNGVHGGQYDASIVDGYLYLTGTGMINAVNETFTFGEPSYEIDEDVVNSLCYEYHYDHRNRVVDSRIPGRDFDYIIYDKRDRPVLTQDGKLREEGQWLFTKYDVLDRPVYSGKVAYDVPCSNTATTGGNTIGVTRAKWTTDTGENSSPENTITTNHCKRVELQELVDSQTVINETATNPGFSNGGTSVYYTNTVFPTNNIGVHTINYYDDYRFDWNQDASFTHPTAAGSIYGQPKASRLRNLPTGSKVRVLGEDHWITAYSIYDKDAQVIFVATYNSYLQTADIIKSRMDFSGTVLETEVTHQKSGHNTITTKDLFTYDHHKRPLTHKQQINNQQLQLINHITYDELGRVQGKKVGGNTAVNEDFTLPNTRGLQDIDYTYTIRGWLKGINEVNENLDPLDGIPLRLFNFELSYDQNNGVPSVTSQYNGNISSAKWQTANEDQGVKAYRYDFDAMNRMTQAQFVTHDLGGSWESNREYYEQIEGYDKNGNILGLFRTSYHEGDAFAVWDDLDYSYSGNQLTALREKNSTVNTSEVVHTRDRGFYDGADQEIEYTYDINGNMLSDANKSITSITYNHLNLPLEVVVNGASANGTENGTISYVYDALGTKLEKKMEQPGGVFLTTTYAGGYIYETSQAVPEKLQFFGQPEGYVQQEDTGEFTYVFQYTDHLGNVRLSYIGREEFLGTETFDTGLDGWTKYHSSTVISNENGKLKAAIIGNNKGVQEAYTVPENTQTLEVSLDIERSVMLNFGLRLVLREYGANGFINATSIPSIPDNGFSTSFDIDPTATSVRLYVLSTGLSSGQEEYFYVDNVSINAYSELEIVEENHYFPFGLKHEGYNTNVSSSNPALKRKYNGIELEEGLGINFYEMDLRLYDPAIARWNGMDPVVHYDFSPYSAFDNNPVYYADPSGADSADSYGRDGAALGPDAQWGQQLGGITSSGLDIPGFGGMSDAEKLSDILNYAESNPNQIHYYSNGTLIGSSQEMKGMNYELTASGHLNPISPTSGVDKIFASGARANENGIIQGQLIATLEYAGQIASGGVLEDGSVYIKFNNDEKSKEVFEALASNSNVEWGQVLYDKNSSYVLTSHSPFRVSSITGSLLKNGHIVRESNHSHPTHKIGSDFPSGYAPTADRNMRIKHPHRDGGDWKHRDNLISRFRERASSIKYHVYSPASNSYVRYGEHRAHRVINELKTLGYDF